MEDSRRGTPVWLNKLPADNRDIDRPIAYFEEVFDTKSCWKIKLIWRSANQKDHYILMTEMEHFIGICTGLKQPG